MNGNADIRIVFGALAIALLFLGAEWHVLQKAFGIERMSLERVESSVRRVPDVAEVIATNLLTLLLVILSAQFVATVYAMSYTLVFTTTEVKDTRRILVSDFNNDGTLDFIALNSDGTDSYHFDYYRNNGSFSYALSTFGDSANFQDAAGGDIDGDGDIDIVVSNGNAIYKYVNNGDNTFSKYTIISSLAQNVTNIVMADFDNDGDIDIVATSNGAHEIGFYRNDGHGNFTAVVSPLPQLDSLCAADLDNDGDIDIAGTQANARVVALKNSGTGAFVLLQTITVSGLNQPIACADFNGDGNIDIVVTDGANILRPYLGNASGVFSLGTVTPITQMTTTSLQFGDIDNDGDLDIISGGNPAIGVGGADILINDGSAVFGAAGVVNSGNGTLGLGIADLDNDGDLDYIRGNTDVIGSTGQANTIYESDQELTSTNTAPTAPGILTLSGTIAPRMPLNAKTFANDNTVGIILWNNLGNAGTSDDAYTVTSSMMAGEITQYLKASGFSFNVPSDATIHGIRVDVEKSRVVSTFVDNSVRIVKGGTFTGDDKADTITNWPAADAYVSYGGPTDLWGTTWTPSDINAANFGFGISGQAGSIGAPAANIDHIRITVYYSNLNLRLSWGSGSDTETPTKLLQYQVRVGTGAGAHNIMSSKTVSPIWVTRLMPNSKSRSITLNDLPCRTGLTYYWSVATVDTGFKTATSPEQTFTIDNDCVPSFGGGGGSPPPSAGGGLSARYFRGNGPDVSGSQATGIITVSAYDDLDGDGVRDARELAAFAGLPLTASGRTADDLAVRKSLTLGAGGVMTFELPASDDKGYWIIVDTGATVLAGYEATGLTQSGGYVLRSGSQKKAEFGFRRKSLLRYRPCLTVGSPSEKERSGTDATVLLQRLEDAFGQKTVRGVDLKGELVSRKEFFTLLMRTQCVEPVRDAATLEKQLRPNAKTFGYTLPLIDLPNDTKKADSLLMYSLLAGGADAIRRTTIGDAADLGSPVTRGEAIRAVMTVLNVPDSKKITEGELPGDLETTDPLATDFLTLESLGILPESFMPVLGSNQGIDGTEAALLLVRAAFGGGRINLLPEILPLNKAAAEPTFLAGLPVLKPDRCLAMNEHRGTDISFSDVLPGDGLFADLRTLLAFGTRNSGNQMLWLLGATRRPTEFGIAKGQTKAGLDEPLSILETVRNLLVYACIPPERALDVLSGKAKATVSQGSGESRVPRDRISDLPRDASFASRVLYRAQDHQKEFDLSLFTYAPRFLRGDFRSPGSGLSVSEASDLLASALLMIQVRAKAMTPQEAEKKAESLSAAIRKDLLGKDVDWRSAAVLDTVPFTKRMLVRYFSTIVSGKTTATPAPPLPLGALWWERVK